MKMPNIKNCDTGTCGYNREGMCHAIAINVGASGPKCDAFLQTNVKCGDNEVIGGVGACKMKDCQFNSCLICTAPEISVKWNGDQALCQTYRKV